MPAAFARNAQQRLPCIHNAASPSLFVNILKKGKIGFAVRPEFVFVDRRALSLQLINEFFNGRHFALLIRDRLNPATGEIARLVFLRSDRQQVIHAEQFGGRLRGITVSSRTDRRDGARLFGFIDNSDGTCGKNFFEHLRAISFASRIQIRTIELSQKLHLPHFVLINVQCLLDIFARKTIKRFFCSHTHSLFAGPEEPLAPDIPRINGHQRVIKVVNYKLHKSFLSSLKEHL